jgi:LmbE family N-acetylglucosaminyl deacetylase
MKLNFLLKKIALFCQLILFSLVANATIVVIAPHPDDAESSCGGLITNAVLSGERVIILTMTKGEIGIGGKTQMEVASIRQAEAISGATTLGAEVMFFGAIDGSLYDDAANTLKLKEILIKINPSIVLAPWPLDVHNDHQATGMLAWRVFQDKSLNFNLYFYETSNEPHTMSFRFVPTDYVDISDVMDKKREATLKHTSQHAGEWFPMYEIMATMRGYEADVKYAEGYIKAQNSGGMGGKSAIVNKTLK